jgi:hypothetical protein
MLLSFQYYKSITVTRLVRRKPEYFLITFQQANTKSVETKMQAMFDKNTKDQLAKAQHEQGVSVKLK